MEVKDFRGWCFLSLRLKRAGEIIDDKLYFNYNLKVKERWEENREDRIEDANENWPNIKDDEL